MGVNTCYYYPWSLNHSTRGRSRTAATSKMECFVIIVNNRKPLTVITKRSILDLAIVLDPPLFSCHNKDVKSMYCWKAWINFWQIWAKDPNFHNQLQQLCDSSIFILKLNLFLKSTRFFISRPSQCEHA